MNISSTLIDYLSHMTSVEFYLARRYKNIKGIRSVIQAHLECTNIVPTRLYWLHVLLKLNLSNNNSTVFMQIHLLLFKQSEHMLCWCAIINLKVPYKKANGIGYHWLPLNTIRYLWTIEWYFSRSQWYCKW